MAIKTDCAAWDAKGHGCKALKELVCCAGKCPFYKTAAQVEADSLIARQRLRRATGVNLDPPVKAATAPKETKRPYAKGKSEEEKKKARIAYFKARRARRIAEGICPVCGKKNDRAGKTLCSACAERQARSNAESWKRKKARE